MEKEAVKKRIIYMDNIKGILIFLVVFGHFLYGLQDNKLGSTIVEYIYYFHMPAFIFVSGFFSKSSSSRLLSGIGKLIVSYVIIMLPFLFIDFLRGESINLFNPQYSAWYLLSLIAFRLIAPYITRIRYSFIVSLVFSLLIGYVRKINDINLFAICKIVTFIPFFMAGYLIDSEKIDRYFRNRKNKYLVSVVMVSLSFVIYYVSHYLLNGTMEHLLACGYINPVNDLLIRICMFLISFMMIAVLLMITPDKEIFLLTESGKNSLSVYIIHRIITLIYVRKIASYLPVSVQIPVALVLTVIVIGVTASEWFSGYLNLFINNSARIIAFEGKEVKLIYKIMFVLLALALVLMPVVQKLLF